MPLMLDQLGPCPVCGAAVAVTGPLYRQHIDWHNATGTAGPFVSNRGEVWAPPADDTPTQKFPPISETVLRRPPPVPVRDLSGSELLRALAAQIDAELREDQGDDDARPGCFASTVLTGDRECRWPGSTPCLAYGVEGCGMKAQES